MKYYCSEKQQGFDLVIFPFPYGRTTLLLSKSLPASFENLTFGIPALYCPE
jgi:hypothetical protein